MTIEIDEAEIAPKPIRIWLFHFLNRLNYNHPIKSVTYQGQKLNFKNPEKELPKIKLKDKDSLI